MFWFWWIFCWVILWLAGAIYAWQSAEISIAAGGKGIDLAIYIFAFTPIYLLIFSLMTAFAWLLRWSIGLQKIDPKYRSHE